MRLPTSLALFVVLFTACSAAPPPPRFDHTLVLIRTGARTKAMTKEERDAMFQGHFANMGRLAEAGYLQLAGPYGQQKSAADLRGLFIMVGTPEQVRPFAETDPGFQATEFRFEYLPFATDARLGELVKAEFARIEANKHAATPPKPGEGMRRYVLATCGDGAAAERVLRSQPGTLMWARLGDGRGFAVLDAENVPAAEALLAPHRAQLGAVAFDEWFATDMVVTFGRPAG